jgi:hypothetical protein
VTRYSWGEIKEANYSMESLTSCYWSRKRKDIAEKMLSDLLVTFPHIEYELEEYERS